MKINRENYEQYFIEYLDGLLNKASREALLSFLEENPDLKTELNEIESMGRLQPKFVEFENKEALKRTEAFNELEDAEVLQQQMIAMIEGELDSKKTASLQQFLGKNVPAKNEFRILEQTQLKPDTTIVYPNKKGLKREPKIITLNRTILAIAALLIISLFVYNFYPQNRVEPSLADRLDVLSKKEKIKSSGSFENGSVEKKIKGENGTYKKQNSGVKANEELPFLIAIIKPIKANKLTCTEKYSADVIALKTLALQPLAVVPREEKEAENAPFLTLKMLAMKKIFGIHQDKKNNETNGWMIADAGVTQFNRLSKKKIVLKKYENERGENNKIQLKFGKLEFEKSLASK